MTFWTLSILQDSRQENQGGGGPAWPNFRKQFVLPRTLDMRTGVAASVLGSTACQVFLYDRKEIFPPKNLYQMSGA